MLGLPVPRNFGTFNVEPYAEYRARWPKTHDDVPNDVIETWIYRHWREFQMWLPLRPLEWTYQLTDLTSDEILKITQLRDWMTTLRAWGDDLLDGTTRSKTWLGRFILENGTTPRPMIVARNASSWNHPQHGCPMKEPLQLIEGHLRLAYLQALVRRSHPTLKPVHKIMLATLPPQ